MPINQVVDLDLNQYSLKLEKIIVSFSEIGNTVLTPSMKDFIASIMLARDWQRIIKDNLRGVVKVDQIFSDYSRLYEQSYAVLRKLVETKNVRSWSEMKEVLKNVDAGIVKAFEDRYRNSRSG